MAFLHCHSCGWEQDDFWSKDYTPLDRWVYLQDQLKKALSSEPGSPDRVVVLDKWVAEDTLGLQPDQYTVRADGLAEVPMQHYIAATLRMIARTLEVMVWWTEEEYKASPRSCPKCGSDQLDID